MLRKNRVLPLIISIAVVVVVVVFVFLVNLRGCPTLGEEEKVLAGDWINLDLKNVKTQETFKISDFEGKKVLLESFAVWCPTCTRQQRELGELYTSMEGEIIIISLDTDPNEDERKILEHMEKNNFNWIYSVSPVDLTRSLIDQFGIGIVNAPDSPVVLICEDGNARKLPGGLKSTNELKAELSKGC